MNRKEFQQWLEQFPEDTVIQVSVSNYGDGEPVFEDFDANNKRLFRFMDLEDHQSNKHKFLEIGSQ